MLTSAISISREGTWTASSGQIYAVFLGLHILQGLLCCSTTRILARLQNVFILANFAIILATFVALPAATPVHQRNSTHFIFGGWENVTGWVNGFAFVTGIFHFIFLIVAWLSPVWSVGGFDACVHISEEASNASTAVPFAILSAISCAGVLGWLCIIVIVACMGTDITSHLASPYGQPMASIYALRLGKEGTLAIWIAIFVTQFAMGTSLVVACSRQLWAFSRDNALPMSRLLKRLTTNAVPVYAVSAAILCSVLLGMASLSRLMLGLLALINTASAQAVFALTVLGTYSAYVWSLSFVITGKIIPIFSRLAWGGRIFKPGPFHLGKFSKPVGWIAVTYMSFMIVILCFVIPCQRCFH